MRSLPLAPSRALEVARTLGNLPRPAYVLTKQRLFDRIITGGPERFHEELETFLIALGR